MENLGILIFLTTLSYVFLSCIPEIKYFLKKESNTANTYNYSFGQQHQTDKIQNIAEQEQEQEVKIEEEASLKMDRIFLEPDLGSKFEKNFSILGE